MNREWSTQETQICNFGRKMPFATWKTEAVVHCAVRVARTGKTLITLRNTDETTRNLQAAGGMEHAEFPRAT